MGYLLPGWEVLPEQRTRLRERTINTMYDIGANLTIWQKKNLRGNVSVRDLLPQDMGRKSWQTPPGEPDFWSVWDFTCPHNSVIGIWKLLQLSDKPKITTLKISTRRNILRGLYDLEHCYGGLPIINAMMDPVVKEVLDRITNREHSNIPALGTLMEGYFTEPHVIQPLDCIQIAVQSPWHFDGDQLVFGGVIMEPFGTSIT